MSRDGPTISLLHATHRAGRQAVETRDRWLALADRPELVEHLFAYDADDEVSAAEPAIAAVAPLPPGGGAVTAVRNWNAAAARARGDVLCVIADDLAPATAGWDTALRSTFGSLDATAVPFAVKVDDGHGRDEHLMRHPVVSRAFYRRHGLFDDVYAGIGADNELTLVAHAAGLVIDGRAVHLRHEHPTLGSEPTESHRRMRADEARREGKALFDQRWPTWRRRLLMRYFRPRPSQVRVHPVRLRWRCLVARSGWAAALLPGSARRPVRRAVERLHRR